MAYNPLGTGPIRNVATNGSPPWTRLELRHLAAASGPRGFAADSSILQFIWRIVANWYGEPMAIEHTTIKAPAASDPLLAEMVRRLVEGYHPERIYLFGSTARGDAGPDSDYDLLIVVSDDVPASRRSPDLGYAVAEGLPRSGDFLVWTRHRFDSRLHLKASLPSTVLREGKLLYAA